MTKRVRAFVAVEAPEAVRRELGRLARALRLDETPGLRLTRPESLHLTLSFLGDVEARSVGIIADALSDAVYGLRPFEVRLGRAGTFPERGAPRVLWVGLAGDLPALADLQERIAGAMSALGYARERRPFRPHLTLGRFRPNAPADVRRRAAEALRAGDGPAPIRMRMEEVVLMRSTLLPTGAVYQRLERARLGGYGAE